MLLCWIIIPLNMLMIVSTLADGGHYLSDVLSGVVIAVAGMLLVRRWLPNPPK